MPPIAPSILPNTRLRPRSTPRRRALERQRQLERAVAKFRFRATNRWIEAADGATRTESGSRIDGRKMFCKMSPAATHLYAAVRYADGDRVERYAYSSGHSKQTSLAEVDTGRACGFTGKRRAAIVQPPMTEGSALERIP
jgi:hypothetical protein